MFVFLCFVCRVSSTAHHNQQQCYLAFPDWLDKDTFSRFLLLSERCDTQTSEKNLMQCHMLPYCLPWNPSAGLQESQNCVHYSLSHLQLCERLTNDARKHTYSSIYSECVNTKHHISRCMYFTGLLLIIITQCTLI